ncbi:MAG: arabinofuranosyltransferase [Bacteroidia bacterium]|nr:arabinofuranosyltransferase [Bacteroidia bacterium]NNF31429.1 arabinofuranosyltransferase [Flavobacteriaceae bacterium]NNM07585.1 arabinofuranosyltransferase [Flavobacteriaceae bacterium]
MKLFTSIFRKIRSKIDLSEAALFFIGAVAIILFQNQFYQFKVIAPAENIVLLLIAVMAILIAAVFQFKLRKIAPGFLLIYCFSLLLSFSALWILREYRFGFNGMRSDAYFNLALISTYYENWISSDFSYKGLSSFYPYYYQFFSGKIGSLFQIPPYVMAKLGTLLVLYVIPIISYKFWKRAIGQGLLAAVLVVVSFLAFPYPYYVKPYKIITILLILPWFYYYFVKMKKGGFLSLMFGGFLGGMLFGTYYFFFILLVLAVVLYIIYYIFSERKGLRSLYKEHKSQLIIVCWTIVFASPFLAPYVIDLLTHPVDSNQNKFFLANSIRFEWLSLNNWPLVVSIFYFTVTYKDRLSRYLLTILGACLIFMLFAYTGLLNNKPVLISHVYPMALMISYIGLVLGIDRLLGAYKPESLKPVLLGLSCILFYQQGLFFENIQRTKMTDLENSWLPTILFDEKFPVENLRNKVLLTNVDLNCFVPSYKFLERNAFFSHPSSQITERMKFLYALQFFDDPVFQRFMLQHNRFEKVDYIIFVRDNGKLYLHVPNFPYQPFIHRVPIDLSALVRSNTEMKQVALQYNNILVYKLAEKPVNSKSFTQLQKKFIEAFGDDTAITNISGTPVSFDKGDEYLGDFSFQNLELFRKMNETPLKILIEDPKAKLEVGYYHSQYTDSGIIYVAVEEYYVFRRNFRANEEQAVDLEFNFYTEDSLVQGKKLNWLDKKESSYRKDQRVYYYFEIDAGIIDACDKMQFRMTSRRFELNKSIQVDF